MANWPYLFVLLTFNLPLVDFTFGVITRLLRLFNQLFVMQHLCEHIHLCRSQHIINAMIKSCIQTRSRCYRTRITTYCTLLGNDPPSIVTHSFGFVSRPAFVPEDGKTNHRLISLGKIHFKKRMHSCNGGKIVPM